MRRLFLLLTLAAALAAFSLPAHGQGVACGERDSFISSLEKGYTETPVFRALTADGNMLEVFTNTTSPDETWTILVTKPGGTTCMVASGKRWMVLRSHLSGENT